MSRLLHLFFQFGIEFTILILIKGDQPYQMYIPKLKL